MSRSRRARFILLTTFTTIAGLAASQQQPPPAQPQQQQPQQPGLTLDPFPTPIETTDGVITVNFAEFAVIPDVDNGEAPRMMHLVDEPGTRRLFVSTMRGMLYSVSYDGKTVTPYLDINAAKWGDRRAVAGSRARLPELRVPSAVRQRGTPGTASSTPTPTRQHDADARLRAARRPTRTHDTVLLEWTAKDPAAAAYDGDAPRELFRVAHPFAQSQRRPDRVQPAGEAGHARTSGCSTSASPTAAAAAIR